MPITIAICDDDNVQIKKLRFMLEEWSERKPLVLHIDEYSSAENFLFSYPDNPCDLLLLDIEMRGLNGVSLAKQLRANNDFLPIVFITGYSEYMSDGYEVEALHYLVKPINKEKLFDVLDRYMQRHGEEKMSVLLPCVDRIIHISPDIIVFCEAFGKQSHITLSNGSKLICTCGIGALTNRLGNDFIVCHRSYLVNLRFVRSIEKITMTITLDNGEKLPLSRRMYGKVNQAFIAYYTNRPVQ